VHRPEHLNNAENTRRGGTSENEVCVIASKRLQPKAHALHATPFLSSSRHRARVAGARRHSLGANHERGYGRRARARYLGEAASFSSRLRPSGPTSSQKLVSRPRN